MAAPVFVSQGSGSGSVTPLNNNSLNLVGSNLTLVVLISNGDSGVHSTTTGVTWNGTSMSKLGTAALPSNPAVQGNELTGWILGNAASGNRTLSVASNITPSNGVYFGAIWWSGSSATQPEAGTLVDWQSSTSDIAQAITASSVGIPFLLNGLGGLTAGANTVVRESATGVMFDSNGIAGSTTLNTTGMSGTSRNWLAATIAGISTPPVARSNFIVRQGVNRAATY